MEFLPEDPDKRKKTLIALGVLGAAVVGVFAWQFFGGDSAPSDPAQVVDQGTPPPTPTPTPDAPAPRRGGSARYEGK